MLVSTDIFIRLSFDGSFSIMLFLLSSAVYSLLLIDDIENKR